ncbi:hypothetical protein BJ875DRAFT_453604 [Amylocarpus encephaloides]|uniref:Uncharacterized protein n=1 Tax=Amylocarpus encephaloides TaxID=45428 RepID=A0A9P7YQY1_9HELO|nr:hypothetical protein BJ875DRAFT_453604 [Amylocarpus encephaloides]
MMTRPTCLESEDFEDDIGDQESHNPVAATWAITFDHVLTVDPLAAEILSVMSSLDTYAIAIPESLNRHTTGTRTNNSPQRWVDMGRET